MRRASSCGRRGPIRTRRPSGGTRAGIETPRESVHIDARVGGRYSYTMIAPDGTEYPTAGIYREITPPERIVMTWGSPRRPDELVPVSAIDLAEHGECAASRR